MTILCTICARGGSKGLSNKALRKINNKPLISYTVRQAIKSNFFDEVVVSTDSKKIQSVAKNYGAKSWFLRPMKYANDSSSKLLAIRHALVESEKFFKKKFNICVDLDITAPLRNINDIKQAVKKFIRHRPNNIISVCDAKKNPYFNMVEECKGEIKLIKQIKDSNKFSRSFASDFEVVRRQDAPKVYEMNASIYIFSRQSLIKKAKLLNKKTRLFVMPRFRSIDIDEIFDLNLVKLLIKDDKKLFR